MKKNRITQIRRAIDKAVSEMCSRIGEYQMDNEMIGEEHEVNIVMRIDDDMYTCAELVDVWITSDSEREYPNILGMIRRKIEGAINDFNAEQETQYIERLSTRGRRDYYACRA